MKPSEALAAFEEVKGSYGQKDADCAKRLRYRRGEYYDVMQEGSTIRDEPKNKSVSGEHYAILNMAEYAIRDAVNLSAKDPEINVPPLNSRSEDKALKLRQFYHGVYQSSGGVELMQQSADSEIMHGWSTHMVLPDLEGKAIRYKVYEAPYSYPLFKLGSNMFMRALYLRWSESPAAIHDEYPHFNTSTSETDSCEVVEYFDENWRMRFADGQYLGGIKHGWGFVPAVHIPFIRVPGTLGMGLADQMYGLNIEADRLRNLLAKAIEENVYADTVAYTDDEVSPPQEYDHGKRRLWTLGMQSKMEKMDSTLGNTLEAFRIYSELLEQGGMMAGSSAARQGRREGMYISSSYSKNLSVALGDMLDNYRSVKGNRMSLLFEYAARLAERHFANTEMDLFARLDGKGHNIRMKGGAFKGYYRCDVSWPPVMSTENWHIMWMQLQKSGIVSEHTARAKLSVIEDPAFEKKQIEEEAFAKAKLEAAMQEILMEVQQQAQAKMSQLSATPGAGVGNPDTVEFEQKQLEKGRTNETANGLFAGTPMREPAPMQPPGRQALPAGGQAMPMPLLPPGGGGVPANGQAAFGMPEADTAGGEIIEADQLIAELKAIQKIKGSVYLAGAVVYNGSIDPAAGDKIELFITNNLDKQTIINALPQYRGLLVFHTTDTAPGEPHVVIFDEGEAAASDEIAGIGGGMEAVNQTGMEMTGETANQF